MDHGTQSTPPAAVLFDTEDHARAWGDDMLALGHMPGVSDIETLYDVTSA